MLEDAMAQLGGWVADVSTLGAKAGPTCSAPPQLDSEWTWRHTPYVLLALLGLYLMADLSYYVLVSLVAQLYDHAFPEPGHPAYDRVYRRQKRSGTFQDVPADPAKLAAAKWAARNDSLSPTSPLSPTSCLSPTSPLSPRHHVDSPRSDASGDLIAAEGWPPQRELSGSSGCSVTAHVKMIWGDQETIAQAAGEDLVHPALREMYTSFPLVLVQVPMYNEAAHCELVVEHCCRIAWPSRRMMVQICDDSTDASIRARIDAKAAEMRAAGHWVEVSRRAERVGYKAGNLLAGLRAVAATPFQYYAVFDADFEPPVDYLYQTIWHMEADARLAFVQGRWAYTNGSDSALTWFQRVAQDYHFYWEQRARSFLGQCFGFNGTAGVWRAAAYRQAGGWDVDTLVEDMDISIRAYAAGWKFKYLDHVRCLSELPPTYEAYRTQQYRWSVGPAQVLKKSFHAIVASRSITPLERLDSLYFLFRYFMNLLEAVLILALPPCMLLLPPWQLFSPALMAGTAAAVGVWGCAILLPLTGNPLAAWPLGCLLSVFRAYAFACGILGLQGTRKWKVTLKVGDGASWTREYHPPYLLEGLCTLYFGAITAAAAATGNWLALPLPALLGTCYALATFGDYLA